MTRVAKARRKVGVTRNAVPLADAWGFAQAGPPEPLAFPGPTETATLEESIEADEEEAMRIKSALRPDVQEHLVGLVRRVFLPPPLGAGARTVLFAAADGGRDESDTCVQAAELLSRHTARTVCLVDAHGELLADEPGGRRADADGTSLAHSPFRQARPLGRNLWRARDGSGGDRRHTIEDAKRWFADLASRFDYVLVDAAAMQDPGGASALASMVEGVILVLDERQTRRASARTVADQLHDTGARLLGVVLTNRSYPIPGKIYRRV